MLMNKGGIADLMHKKWGCCVPSAGTVGSRYGESISRAAHGINFTLLPLITKELLRMHVASQGDDMVCRISESERVAVLDVSTQGIGQDNVGTRRIVNQ
jgi:hypothetical protein